MMETLYINGYDIKDIGADAIRSYKVGGTEIKNDYFQGRNRTYYNVLSRVFALKPITIEIAYHGDTRHEVMLKKSKIDAEIFGECELYLPDGFFYRCMIDKISEIGWQGVENDGIIGIVKYTFDGMQHDALITTGGTMYAQGTMPQMDCRLSVTVTTAADSYNFSGAVYPNVLAGEKLVFDGITKRILRNGAPGAAGVQWIHFPVVKPGNNTFIAPDPVTVEYYPCYM